MEGFFLFVFALFLFLTAGADDTQAVRTSIKALCGANPGKYGACCDANDVDKLSLQQINTVSGGCFGYLRFDNNSVVSYWFVH